MTKSNILVLYFFICTKYAFSQEIASGSISAMANAGVALQTIWSVNHNPAGISNYKTFAVSGSYENKYGIKDLNSQSIITILPFQKHVFAVSFQRYGTSFYSTNKSSLSLAKAFDKYLSLAVTLNFHQLHIENYTNSYGFSADVGVQFQLFKNFWIASHVSNPNQSKYKNVSDEIIPSHLKFGFCYLLSDKIKAASEIQKIVGYEADFKLGLEYKLMDAFSIRGGVSANTFKQYGGFGLLVQKAAIDFSVISHPVLGYSPQIAVGYEF